MTHLTEEIISKLAFEVIREILQERLGKIPPQMNRFMSTSNKTPMMKLTIC